MKTQTNRQITVVLENRPGQLAKVCRLLAENGINIEAISAVEGVEYGVIRITTSDRIDSDMGAS
jgi:hypothetical protein